MSKADRASSTRRSLLAEGAALAGLAGGFALLAGAAIGAPGSEHPDATLLACEPALRRLQSECDRLWAEVGRLSHLCEAECAPRPNFGEPSFDAWAARFDDVLTRNGQDVAEAASDAAIDRRGDALDRLSSIPARTLDGLCLKARYAIWHDTLAESVIDDLVAIDRSRAA